MHKGKEFISDYDENKDDIEYWFSIKCEQKYERFAELLKSKEEETTWANVKDLYRYDKRLIFNCFKYISFLEEYLRATIVRNSVNKDAKYKELQKSNLSDLINPIIELNDQGIFCYDRSHLENDLHSVKTLRNFISHNKIVLETDYKSEITALRDLLPSNYTEGFERIISESSNGLSVSDKWVVSFSSLSRSNP